MGRTEGSPEELAGGQKRAGQKRAGPFYNNLISDHRIFSDPVSDGQGPREQVSGKETPEEKTREERTSEKWRKVLGPYGGADLRRSLTQILTSAAPFFVFWYAAYRAL